eukprot:1404988-Heterocapsa_arctica.AAC.1
MNNDLPPGWPAGFAKPDDEAHAAFNLAHRAAELNEEATKACAAVAAVAEATKAANIAALHAYAATKKTKIAEDEATAKHVQEKAAAAVLADAEVTQAANIAKAAEDEAAAKL